MNTNAQKCLEIWSWDSFSRNTLSNAAPQQEWEWTRKGTKKRKEKSNKVFVPFCGDPSDAERVKDGSLGNAKW